MHTYRLVRLIESHSEALANSLLERVQRSAETVAYANVPPEELKQRVFEIYEHLGEWLLGKRDLDIQRRYREIGARRYQQHVPLPELIWAIVLTKETLWQFLTWETLPDRPMEVFGEIELVQLVGQFFDRAIQAAAEGYEEARLAEHIVAGNR